MEENNLRYAIQEADANDRLDKVLSRIEAIGSRSRAATLIEELRVTLNGKAVKASHVAKLGEIFDISLPEIKPLEIVAKDIPLEILYEDADLIVINKQSGLVVHPAAGHFDDTLVNGLLFHAKDFNMKFGEVRPGIVHRLDKETSGVMVVAKNDSVQEALAKQFKDRTVDRFYYAITIPNSLPKTGTIVSYLARHSSDRKKFASLKNKKGQILREKDPTILVGKWSHTDFELIKKEDHGICLYRLKLQTGRTHQIRIHLSEMGANIIGDEIYGAKRIPSIRDSKTLDMLKHWPRLALHAAELGFVHPRTGKRMNFKVPWPDEMDAVLKQLDFEKLKYENNF